MNRRMRRATSVADRKAIGGTVKVDEPQMVGITMRWLAKQGEVDAAVAVLDAILRLHPPGTPNEQADADAFRAELLLQKDTIQ